ncbi:glycosyltransferase family 25 protein [Vibrio astriarenae]
MKIVVISLKRATERRATITKQLDDLSLDYQIFNAIDAEVPCHLHHDKRRDKSTVRRLGYKLVAGEVACYASHYEVWELAVTLDEPVLVIEDNVKLLPGFKQALASLKEATHRHHYIKLFAYFPRQDQLAESLSEHLKLYRSRKRYSGAQGYIITPYAAKRFISASQGGFYEPVDDFMEKPYKHSIKTVVTKPNLVERLAIKSTISSASVQRKDKSGASLLTKLGNEVFRSYEKLRNKIESLKTL